MWLGGTEPSWSQRFMRTWLRDGWSLAQWNDATVQSLEPMENQALWDLAPEILRGRHVHRFRSDLLRFELTWRFGGIYVDADLECVKPIDPLIEGVECFASWEEQDHWVNGALMGAVPGHPFIGALIRGAPAAVERSPGANPAGLIGPRYVTKVWKKHGGGVRVLGQAAIFPYSWAEVPDHDPAERWEGAYAIHHWANHRKMIEEANAV